MTANTQDRIEALEVALNNEQQEAAFYLKHAERTTDPLGKKMFETLAADEQEHYQRIQALHQKLKEGGKWPDTLPLTVKGTKVRDVLQSVVEAVAQAPETRTNDMEAVKIAIAFESKGEAHYKKLREGADDPVEKSFYGLLESIEREHRLSLEDTYEYFKDPESWFQRMEKHGLDGA
jgi:rubrerythrin